MRTRMAWLIGLLALSAGGFLTWSLTRGQNPSGSNTSTVSAPTGTKAPSAGLKLEPTAPIPEGTTQPLGDAGKLSPLQKQMYASALRGTEWLIRANRTDGRFVYGYLPALRRVMEGDHYLQQAGAAFALARAAH